MRPIVPITLAAAGAAAAVLLLPAGARGACWTALGVSYLAVAAWGTARLSSGIFGTAFTRGSPSSRQVALTFDDGPDARSTPPLLDLLRSRGVAATFFAVGEKVQAHPDIVRRCAEEGHLVANHSHRHSVFTNFLCGAPLRRELEACQEAIGHACGARPRYYRPPFGLTNHALPRAAAGLGLEVVGWDARGMDLLHDAERTARRILLRARPGAIILLHDGNRDPRAVVAAAARVLDGLEERGLSPVRLDRLAR